MAQQTTEYTVTIRLKDGTDNARWTPEREAKNLEKVVRAALVDEYGRSIVRSTKAEVKPSFESTRY